MTGTLQLSPDTKAVLVADAVMFLLALLLGVWKYRQIATSKEHAPRTFGWVDVNPEPGPACRLA